MKHLRIVLFGILGLAPSLAQPQSGPPAQGTPGSSDRARITALEAAVRSLDERLQALERADRPSRVEVDCTAGQSVQQALDLAGRGALEVVIHGRCRENV